jgi:hypothetical protein
MIEVSNQIEKIIITKLVVVLSIIQDDLKELSAYRLGLINDDLNVIRKPKTKIEKAALNPTVRLALDISRQLFTNKVLKPQEMIRLEKEHCIRSAINLMVDNLTEAEQKQYLQTVKGLTANTEKSMTLDVDQVLDDELDKIVHPKYNLIGSRKRRNQYLRHAFGVEDTIGDVE